jgi:hypothetical protein
MSNRRQVVKMFLVGGLLASRKANASAPGADASGTRAFPRRLPENATSRSAGELLDVARGGLPGAAQLKALAEYVQACPVPDVLAPAYLKTMSDIVAGQEVSLARFVDPRRLAAIQRGTSTYDCGADLAQAFSSGARGFYIPRGIWRFSGDLSTAAGTKLRGDGGGEYAVLTGVASAATVLERQDTGNASSAVLTLGPASNIEYVQVRPAHYARAIYDLADYPAGTSNTPVGLRFGEASCARHCTAVGFPTAGFALNVTATAERCYAYMCDKGFYTGDRTDGSLLNCVGMFCHTAGADLAANYWQVIGGRWEWNARYGVILGAESVIVGAVFDRNGFAGLHMKSGHWGKVVTGNYFSRNGCGGNGSLGRWKFSTPKHRSYLEVPVGRSCHIQIDYQQGATITSNRFRHGKDDDLDGCDGPQFVYGSAVESGSTPLEGVTIHGNFGDRWQDTIAGFNKDYPGGGAIAGGTDTNLARRLNLGIGYERGGLGSPMHCGDGTVSAATSRVGIDVLRRSSGRVVLRAATSQRAELAEILFATNAYDKGHTAAVNNVIGKPVKSAVLVENMTDSRYNTVIVDLVEPCFVSYSVFST